MPNYKIVWYVRKYIKDKLTFVGEQKYSMGRPPKVSDLEILDFFISSAEPVFVPIEVANHFGNITKETARNRLDDMAEEGLLAKKKPSERVAMYWITRAGKRKYEQHYRDSA